MLQLHNTLSNSKVPFTPIDEGKIRLYVCGMTVYDYCHIGHARVMVSFDVITRYLRHAGYQVEYVRNITDVDDKIIKRAAENGESCEQLTQRFIDAMHEDELALNVLPPDQEPRATGHIQAIRDMVQTLIEKQYAYAASNGDVYYRVEKFDGYGKLTNRKLEDMRAGARVDINDVKENPFDFVLWKAAKKDEVSWPSPWGEGRPGWHIECSAMTKCCLGNHFDIHGGGPDLPFPHHENEIAQSEAANGETFVNYWLHAGAVRVNKEKMSKSLGNFFTIREVLAKFPAEIVRYLLTASHYRSQIDYAEDALVEAQRALDRLYTAMDQLELQDVSLEGPYLDRFNSAMDDDFNTREAISVLFEMAREVNRLKRDTDPQAAVLASQMRGLGNILGLLELDPQAYLKGEAGEGDLADANVEALVVQRQQAKLDRNFALSDQIRDQLKVAGIVLEDSKEGTVWKREV
ncbi:cysteine--tRNA ligase [Oceanospirillaceae bacterium]|jgi:cysteinyl-tRNA synthetase|nr:cysteine--tRNA ligase [Oceanospirillaceae bacterium]MDC1350764.1 cysteine--tRNA ligase [Oceanospirillaceae bacterium]MDO7555357.1 cysteine--tRNA ligase [Oceanospirillaceae bacterium]MDO7585130.1 cysteine--tRNA ligase [Oceanospirillaceae bacterium]|tara:strand:- start:573 stop:1958 length:1386 start_codon:yes stop_codon:yes gene_type:complete